jgi:hypothetical protein
MEKARQEREPLKVAMMQEPAFTVHKRRLHPEMPAKKRLIFAEGYPGASAQELVRQLQPWMPVKKRISPWLVAEPERVFPALPR